MGRSLSVTVAFGWPITLDEYGEEPLTPLPWATEDGESDLDDWWLQTTGFTEPSPYDENGMDNGTPADVISAWWEARRAWLNEHPIPIELEYAGIESAALVLIRPAGKASGEHCTGWVATKVSDTGTEDMTLDFEAYAKATEFITTHGLAVGEFGLYVCANYR